jgi:putative endonuclease
MYYSVYIIYSQSKERYYIGYSHNLIERLEKHNLGATTSTRSGRPWVLVYKEEYPSKHDAIMQEREMKRMKSRRFIESLLKK